MRINNAHKRNFYAHKIMRMKDASACKVQNAIFPASATLWLITGRPNLPKHLYRFQDSNQVPTGTGPRSTH